MRLTKAFIIEQKDNTYKVRIPIFHGIENSANCTPDSELPYATVATIKGASQLYFKGDVVYVEFEENDLARPVILGALLLNDKDASYPDLNIDMLKVTGKTLLPETTSIGKVTSNEIASLTGVSRNIQKQFEDILNCNSTYNAEYITNEYDSSSGWILEDKGLSLISSFLDENTEEQIDTFLYNTPTQVSDVANPKTFTKPDGTVLIQSDGYDKDYRLRLNWQGVNTIKNDKVKMSYGLYARNYWTLDKGQAYQDKFLAFPEYTWRPSIQSYTNESDLAQATIHNLEENEKIINTGYYPYILQLNPDGGDTLLGRGGIIAAVDHDDSTWNEGKTAGRKQGIKVGDVLIFADSSNNLKQHDLVSGLTKPIGSGDGTGGSSGGNFFLFCDNYQNTSGSFVQTLDNTFEFNGTIYRISVDGKHLYAEGTVIDVINTNTIHTEGSDTYDVFTFEINNVEYTLWHRSFVTPYIEHNVVRRLSIEGIYKQYATTSGNGEIQYDLDRVYSGFIDFRVELIIGLASSTTFTNNKITLNSTTYTINVNSNGDGSLIPTSGASIPVIAYSFEFTTSTETTTYNIKYQNSTTAGVLEKMMARIPITSTQTVQLGTLRNISRVQRSSAGGSSATFKVPVQLDLESEVGINWENLDFHFVVEADATFPSDQDVVSGDAFNDLITIDIKNVTNYLTVLNLQLDNVIQMYKGQLRDSATDAVASINLNARYEGVDISGVYQSTVTTIDTPSYTESI